MYKTRLKTAREKILELLADHEYQHHVEDNGRTIIISDRYSYHFDDFQLIAKLEQLKLPMSIEGGEKVTIEIEYR